MRFAFQLSIRDVDCDFRLFRRHIFETITLESRSGVICVEMARKFDIAGFRMAEVPVSHYPRLHGSSEFFRIRHLQHTLRGLFRIWWSLVLSPKITGMDEYRGQKILLTGGLGFIGSNLAIRLVELGASVTIVDSLDPTCGGNHFNIEPIKNDVELIEADTCDLPLMRKLVRGKSCVFNLAGRVSHIESMDDPFGDLAREHDRATDGSGSLQT